MSVNAKLIGETLSVSCTMDTKFLTSTDCDGVDKAVSEWTQTARADHLYSMADIALEIYGTAFATEEFWRVAVNIGPAIAARGFNRIEYKGRRWWIKKSTIAS